MTTETTAPHGFDEDHDDFRNELASVHKDGRRKWVYARKPSGRFYAARTYVSYVLLALLFFGPFVTLHGQPILLLNVLERKFIVFGIVFWPQDFYLLVLCVLTGFLTIALVTSAVGRIWCGWMCPQTIFLEMLFRKIEWLIEGSAQQQVRRDKAPITFDTAWRKALKHAIFFGLSFLIANVFLAYIISADTLWTIVTDPPREHVAGLFAITVFSLVFYAVFARFREQACTLACPYGRVMGALVDQNTITITYDRTRGEPRGRMTRGAQEAARGDCIDCGQCVTVCPTGIDIRNGIQLECVACTACADACDDVMARIERPKGLIRYTSEEAVRTSQPNRLSWRVKAYATVWLLMLATAATLIARRPAMDVLILRQPGTLQTTLDDGEVSNFYNVQVINRTNSPYTLQYRVVEPKGGSITPLGPIGDMAPYGIIQSRLLLRLPGSAVTGTSTPVRIEVTQAGELVEMVDTSFLAIPNAEEHHDGREERHDGRERRERKD
ncbi:cytochrome c oxidase accessory protein CcoG [Luteitalea sp. TBR-22]|uniref:cytochrome c oxidase accessory protein CcoG n=1 Tax=Luteitalea sp. TBR-22 TaxID=2802971 RepID=UPI001AF3090A|nr:cytochrome c oxidase accessory protein CcoG [Luteitalea sp. TBR-22]BCS34422.1 cytochrome c oxidase accessory protein CcoG [Luteitalea sp. TBR-22]